MTEPVSSSSSSSSANDIGMTIDIRPMIEDVSQVMTKHITNILSGVIGEYTVYKETHDTIMGLPCVRRLQERINELEMPRDNSGCESVVSCKCSGSICGSGGVRGGGGAASREDEIHQLQSAIAELNRYIVALESKVDMKTVYSSPASAAHQEEESIRLEIHENTSENTESEFVIPRSNSKNVIISSSTIPEEPEEEDDIETETTEDLASLVETVQVEIDAEGDEEADDEKAEDEAAEANEEEPEANKETEAADNADANEEEAEEEEAEEEEAEEEEAADEGAADNADANEDEAEEEAADEEAADEEEMEVEEEAAEEEEAEIEVSEVKIKGKTYFTTDLQNGIIYACVDDDVGDEVGVFKNGVALFNKGKK